MNNTWYNRVIWKVLRGETDTMKTTNDIVLSNSISCGWDGENRKRSWSG